jgi:hypothetical protein
MGKVKETVMDVETGAVEDTSEAVLTHNAISMCHIPGEGWSLVVIRYNPVTGEVGKPEKRRTGEGLAYIKERFKIDAINPASLDGLDIFNNSGNNW